MEFLPTVDPMVGANSADSNVGIERATKKVRTRTDLPFEFGDPTVDKNGQKIILEGLKLSYKSTLLGDSIDSQQSEPREEAFLLVEGDAVTEMIDGVPFITFSDRVKDFI